MPITPTREDGRTPWFRSGLYTVIPPHISGAAFSLSSDGGMGIANRELTRILSAYPPFRPTQVGCAFAHRCSSPCLHHSQIPQLSACQPTPTLSPTARSFTADPTAVTVPTISCPGMNGYLLIPQSLSMRWISLKQTP